MKFKIGDKVSVGDISIEIIDFKYNKIIVKLKVGDLSDVEMWDEDDVISAFNRSGVINEI